MLFFELSCLHFNIEKKFVGVLDYFLSFLKNIWKKNPIRTLMTTNTSVPIMELFNRELLIFKCYQVNVKDIKCPFQWWEKYENMFPLIGLDAGQILGIFKSQLR